jgi:hypothetical protein
MISGKTMGSMDVERCGVLHAEMLARQKILGLSACCHDSASYLLVEGEIVPPAQKSLRTLSRPRRPYILLPMRHSSWQLTACRA